MVLTSSLPWISHVRLGNKRSASDDDFEDELDSPLASPTSPTTPDLSYSSGGSDSESSYVCNNLLLTYHF